MAAPGKKAQRRDARMKAAQERDARGAQERRARPPRRGQAFTTVLVICAALGGLG